MLTPKAPIGMFQELTFGQWVVLRSKEYKKKSTKEQACYLVESLQTLEAVGRVRCFPRSYRYLFVCMYMCAFVCVCVCFCMWLCMRVGGLCMHCFTHALFRTQGHATARKPQYYCQHRATPAFTGLLLSLLSHKT
jgi:hypothetical protein